MSQLELPAAIEPTGVPLLPRHLVDLFWYPRRFFAGQVALKRTPYAVFVGWVYGASAAIGRLNENLLRAELGAPRPGWDRMGPYLSGDWPSFWLYVALAGAASGAFLWWLGGWWFSLRLRWSGATRPDSQLARSVMAYSAFVHAAPALAAALLSMAFYASYAEAYQASLSYNLVLIVFPFWSVAVSYTGARTVFGLGGWRVRLWFLILPLAAYVIGLGLLTAVTSWVMTGQGA